MLATLYSTQLNVKHKQTKNNCQNLNPLNYCSSMQPDNFHKNLGVSTYFNNTEFPKFNTTYGDLKRSSQGNKIAKLTNMENGHYSFKYCTSCLKLFLTKLLYSIIHFLQPYIW